MSIERDRETKGQPNRGAPIMQNENTKLKIVRLLDSSLCANCRMAAVATVEMEDGSSRRMLHCKRLDCDNWQTEESAEIPKQLYESD